MGADQIFRRWRAAKTACTDLVGRIRRRVASEHPLPWQPSNIPKTFNGFDTSIEEASLLEGCRRLGVMAVGGPVFSLTRTAIGTAAAAPDGQRCWVKVSAMMGVPTNWLRDGELIAMPDVPKPHVIARREWAADGRHWLALQTMLATSPVVEQTHWAGDRALSVSDAWIAELRDALSKVNRMQTPRMRATQKEVADVIKRHFGRNAPSFADEWQVAHGDLHWNNVTTPTLTILDWQCWGLAPRGCDAAFLVAFSCRHPSLAMRLEQAFASDLTRQSGRVAQLYAIGHILDNIRAGWFDPVYHGTLRRFGKQVLQRS